MSSSSTLIIYIFIFILINPTSSSGLFRLIPVYKEKGLGMKLLTQIGRNTDQLPQRMSWEKCRLVSIQQLLYVMVELALTEVLCTRLGSKGPLNTALTVQGSDQLIRPDKSETAVHGCHCLGDMAARMREVLAKRWDNVRVSFASKFIIIIIISHRASRRKRPPLCLTNTFS